MCGLQYQIFRYYTAAASVGMVLVSMYLQQEEGVVDDSTLRLCLYAVLVLASISASAACFLKFILMKREYNWMWWSKLNVSEHFSKYTWDTVVYTRWGASIDDHRARAISFIFIPRYYLHDDRVKTWLALKWPAWQADPPSWFTDEFKSKLPRSIIPKKESLGTHYVHSGVTESSVHMNEMELFFAFIRNQNLQEQFQYELALYSLTSHSPKAPSFDRNQESSPPKNLVSTP